MVPTLFGRIQTRLFLLATVGVLVTALITPILSLTGPLSLRYQTTYALLAAVAAVGVGWEIIYHLLMQWRWEKDWPTLFGLVTVAPEGFAIWVLANEQLIPGLPGPVPFGAFLAHLLAIWLTTWLAANGPMRVPFIRWRFRGGRLI
ncbi:MAG TPA: hypothetical protein VF163_06055 [Micromonosporaceae bacterium]